MVGFDPDSYTVSEADGTATLTVKVISGTLQTQVSADFSTSPDTALGKLVDYLKFVCHRQQLVTGVSVISLLPQSW